MRDYRNETECPRLEPKPAKDIKYYRQQPIISQEPYRIPNEMMDIRPQMPEEFAVPYYQMYGYPIAFAEEQENEKDMQRLKEMYPDVAKQILVHVEEECDKMEYEGSVMFDERPDRVMLFQIRNGIYDKVKDYYELPEDDDKDEVFAMNHQTRKRYPPRKNWLGDMIDIMLFQEMYRRRCRHRNCRKWY